MFSIQSQVAGVEAGPIGAAQVNLQGDHGGAAVDSQVRVVWETQRQKWKFEILWSNLFFAVDCLVAHTWDSVILGRTIINTLGRLHQHDQ